MAKAVLIGGAFVVCAGVALAFGMADRSGPDTAIPSEIIAEEAVTASLSRSEPVPEGAAPGALTQSAPSQPTDQSPALPTPLVSYETTLGRPIVFFGEGTVGPAFAETLRALDQDALVLDYETKPQSMADVDVYLLKDRNFEAMRARRDHLLHDRIRAQLDGVADGLGFSWFSVGITHNDTGKTRDVIVLLANDLGLKSASDFCVTLMIYEMIRYVHDTPAFQAAQADGALISSQCQQRGWQSVEDMGQRG